MRNPDYQTSICESIFSFPATNAYRANVIYRMLPTALGMKQPREWIKCFLLWELHILTRIQVNSVQQLFTEDLLCGRYLSAHAQIDSWTLPLQNKVGDFPKKVACIEVDTQASQQRLAKVSAVKPRAHGQAVFSGYGIAPRATTIYLLTLSASLTDSESSSCLSDYTLHASHRRAAWWSGIPSSLPVMSGSASPHRVGTPVAGGEPFWAREEWGCGGWRGEGKVAPFHSACELLWVP